MRKKISKIINTYGVIPQLKYFQSEVFELNEAIIKYENEPLKELGAGNKEHIAEEIADVLVMLKQFQYHYGIDDEEIENVMKFKIERQLRRIEGGSNE